MKTSRLFLIFTLMLSVSACQTGPSNTARHPEDTLANSNPGKVLPPKIPDRISEHEAFIEYLDTLSSPKGLSIQVNDPDDQSTYTFCNDTLVILQYGPSEWMVGNWTIQDDRIMIRFFKAAGERGIGDPVVSPGKAGEKPMYAAYVPYVYYTEEEKTLPWQDMKAIMQTEGRSMYVLADKKASCDLTHFNFELPGKYPWLSSRLIESAELSGVNEADLSIMINEIYARYGLIFKDKKLKTYFSKQTWYSPRYNDVNKFIQGIEEKNLLLLFAKDKELQQLKPKKAPLLKKKKSASTVKSAPKRK